MRYVVRTLLGALIFAAGTTAWGQQSLGACKIEDWRWRMDALGGMWIEGATTCPSGRIKIRAYSVVGDDERFLGVMDTWIEGYTFNDYIHDVAPVPQKISIRYTIQNK